MELKLCNLSELYFPRNEWLWLHKPVQCSLDQPDFFLWATRVGSKIWAWHPLGAEPLNLVQNNIRIFLLNTSSELEAHGLFLKTVFQTRPAHDVEWVAALDVLQNRLGFNVTNENQQPISGLPPFWKEALGISGLEPHLGVLATRNRYLFLSQSERQLIFEKNWDLTALELIENFNLELRELFVANILRWNLSASITKESLNNLVFLLKKFGEKAAKAILTAQHKSTEEFRNALFRIAQPEMAHLSETRLNHLRSLRLPPRTTVFADPTLEKDGLKITHTARSINDVTEFATWISDPEISKKMKALLEIYQ